MSAATSWAAPLHREFLDLTHLAKRWDQRFESASGTYPTLEFATRFTAFTERVEAAKQRAIGAGSSISYDFRRLAEGMRAPRFFPEDRLESMAKRRETFKPYRPGSFGSDIPWGALLDGLISDLERGERMLYGKVIADAPTTPPTPNPGVPGNPTWPGGPRPTPLP